MSTKNAPKVTAARVPPPSEIPDAGAFQAPDPSELEHLTLGAPFAMTGDCELVDRGGDNCPECDQPEISGSVSIVQCECGQVFRINLLSSGVKPCPAQCGRTFTHLLLVTTADDDETFADAFLQVLRANGYTVKTPDDDDEPEIEGDQEPEPDDDDEDDDTDPEHEAPEGDE